MWYALPTMAFVVPTKRGAYEVRESHSTPRIFRFSPRGIRKPNPSRGLPIVAFRYPSAATVIGE